MHQLQEVCQNRPLLMVEIEERLQEDHFEHNCLVTEALVFGMIQIEHVFQAVPLDFYFSKKMCGHHSAVVRGDYIRKDRLEHFVRAAVVPDDDIQDVQFVHLVQGPHCDSVMPDNGIQDEHLVHFVRDEELALIVDADPSSWMAH